MAGDVKAAAAILQIVRARVPLNGLEPAGMASGSNRGPRGQWSGIQHGDLTVPHPLGCMPQPTCPDSGTANDAIRVVAGGVADHLPLYRMRIGMR